LGPLAGSWRNPQEAEAVLDYIADLRQQHPEVTFGVVTPYAAQSRLIEGGLRSLGLQDVVKVGTAHRFHGGECDVIVISAVGSGKIPRSVRAMAGRPDQSVECRDHQGEVATRRKRHRQLLTRLDLIAAGGSRPVRVLAWRAVAEPEMVAAEVKRLGSGG
jgi:hypothetical protein